MTLMASLTASTQNFPRAMAQACLPDPGPLPEAMRQSESLRTRLGAALLQKTLYGAVVGLFCTVMYRACQSLAWWPPLVRDDCAGWRMIPFHATWTWPYFSMFGLVGLAWFFLPDAAAVRRFAVIMTAMAAVAWSFFLLWPTACVRPVVADPPRVYQWLLRLDQPTNCFPCLHSAFTVLAAVVIGGWGGRVWRLVLFVWAGVITVSILALRQHTEMDILAGLGLGALTAWIWYRGRDRL